MREVANISRKISEYENKIGIINQERERLESLLKAKSNEANEKDKIARDFEYELESNKRKIVNL